MCNDVGQNSSVLVDGEVARGFDGTFVEAIYTDVAVDLNRTPNDGREGDDGFDPLHRRDLGLGFSLFSLSAEQRLCLLEDVVNIHN